MSARRLSSCLVALVVLMCAGLVRAEPPERGLDVGKLAGGVALVEQTEMFEDTTGVMTLAEVMAPQTHFVPSQQEATFGYTQSSIWLRFRVYNAAARAQPWLLELAFPHLDHIDIYEKPVAGPVQHRVAGDALPFHAREVDVPTFAFPQEAAPHSESVFYVRVRGNGTLRIPMRAWLPLEFARHEAKTDLLLWLFYGIVLAMAFFNLGTAVLLRNREYALFVGVLLSIGASIFTLSGHMFQYVLTDFPALANRALAVCMALGLTFVQLYAREGSRQLDDVVELAMLRRAFRLSAPVAYLTVCVALIAPPALGQKAVFASIVLYIPLGVVMLVRVQKHADAQLRMYSRSLFVLAICIPVAVLAHVKVLPPYGIFIWAGHIGCGLYSIITSLVLPTRINELGLRLEALNQQLSANVVDLKRALASAERATKVKDEFMATMSHELRTPLNAIINVPQGLLEDFPVSRAARCAACQSEFLLDADEQVNPTLACGSCGREGTLRELDATLYVGEPAHTARFLRKIERSGNHLLQMVNGVLDFSKMEAGRLELNRTPVDLRVLLGDVVDQMSDLASNRGIELALHTADSAEPCMGDALRIRQVMLNLITNAIKFSEANSQIAVTWQRTMDTDTISVTDQGIGIAPADQERVFISFEQVHKGDTRKYGGTGLGLSISRSLVRMHGGELWVRSELGVGSTFWFTLPRPAHASVELELPLLPEADLQALVARPSRATG